MRVWVTLLALSAFGAGLGVGWWASARAQEPAQVDSAFAAFERRFCDEFELEPARARAFHALLENYEKDLERAREQALTVGMASTGPELAQLGRRYRDWMRNFVLPPDARDHFDRLSQDAVVWKTVE